jgi:hypothetical protein
MRGAALVIEKMKVSQSAGNIMNTLRRVVLERPQTVFELLAGCSKRPIFSPPLSLLRQPLFPWERLSTSAAAASDQR